MRSIALLGMLALSSCALLEKKSQSLFPIKTSNPTSQSIVGGTEVKPTDPLALQAVLLIIERDAKTSSCTAVPLSSRILLTAAHCVAGAEPHRIKAVFRTDVNYPAEQESQWTARAERFVVHSEFTGTPQSKSDLALIKLVSKIPKLYRSASLYDGTSVLSGDQALMLGYGVTDETQKDSLQLRTTVKSFKNDSFVKDQLLGFKQSNAGGGFCRGDSGAPVYVQVGTQRQLIGINSFNVGIEKNKECHTASFAMYVPHFRSWIFTQLVSL